MEQVGTGERKVRSSDALNHYGRLGDLEFTCDYLGSVFSRVKLPAIGVVLPSSDRGIYIFIFVRDYFSKNKVQFILFHIHYLFKYNRLRCLRIQFNESIFHYNYRL